MVLGKGKRVMRYNNLDDVSTLKNLKDMWQWQKERASKQKDLSWQVEVCDKPQIEFLRHNKDQTTITWVGHSTFWIQLGGKNIVTDPVWAQRMGFSKRLTPPGIPIDQLQPIDIVLISHSHYDHLFFPSIRRLQGDPHYLVPEGLGKIFYQKGYRNVTEFSWWQSVGFDSVGITFVPAQHWSKRTFWDTNQSHWGGWVFNDHRTCIYFAGDTGYFRGFKDIGERYDIDYALMPIGAYEPEWFMTNQHVTPEEAIQGYIDCGADYFVPMHYGAFRLADDTPKEAMDRLHQGWDHHNLDRSKLKTLQIGETLYKEATF